MTAAPKRRMSCTVIATKGSDTSSPSISSVVAARASGATINSAEIGWLLRTPDTCNSPPASPAPRMVNGMRGGCVAALMRAPCAARAESSSSIGRSRMRGDPSTV